MNLDFFLIYFFIINNCSIFAKTLKKIKMKITFEEILSKHEWIHRELLNTLDAETIFKAEQEQFYDIKILINGKEFEPKFFNRIMLSMEKHIENAALTLLSEKLSDAEQEAENFLEKIKEMKDNMLDSFGSYLDNKYYETTDTKISK